MYLQCPRCRSVFEMDPETLGDNGRKVSCAVCSNTWRAKASALLAKLPLPSGSRAVEDSVSRPSYASPPPPRTASESFATSTASPKHAVPPPPPTAEQEMSKRRRARLNPPNIPPPPSGSPNSPRQLGAAAALYAQAHHHSFAPLQFTERNLERKLNELLHFSLSWAVWGMFIVAIIYLVRTYPVDIVTRFPNAVHLYERLNLMRPAFADLLLQEQHYSLGNVEVTSEFRLSRDILLISTSVGNRTGQAQTTPVLRGSFRNSRDEETNYFHFRPIEDEIPGGGTLEYRVNVAKPQATSEILRVTLISLFEAKLDIGDNRLDVQAVLVEQ